MYGKLTIAYNSTIDHDNRHKSRLGGGGGGGAKVCAFKTMRWNRNYFFKIDWKESMCSLSSSRSCIVYGQVRMDLNKVWFHVGVCKVGHSLDSNR